MSLIEHVHGGYVHTRRVRVLAEHLCRVLPEQATVLDIGCGDGLLSRQVQDRRPDLRISGIDVLVRERTHIPVAPFDGQRIPLADGVVDVAMFVDVLHHTSDPMVLLREARRIARRAVVIKDHTMEGFLAGPTLRFMDWVGNARHGVVLPYNYWKRQQWWDAFESLGFRVELWERALGLYAFPGSLFFGRSLHFLALCQTS